MFEADTAMIIHDMDPPDLYPYKAPAMSELFAAFQALIGDAPRVDAIDASIEPMRSIDWTWGPPRLRTRCARASVPPTP